MRKIMMKTSFLTILIVFFSVQMLNLWSDNFNFESLFRRFADNNSVNISGKKYLLISDSVELYYENNQGITIGRIPEDYQLIYGEVIKLILQMTSKGSIVDGLFDANEMKDFARVVYDLEMPLNIEVFSEEFGANLDNINRINRVDQLGLMTNPDNKEQIILYLLDYSSNEMVFFVTNDEEAKSIFNKIDTYKKDVLAKKYVGVDLLNSMDQENFQKISVPLPSENLVYDIDLYFESPFVTEAGLNREELEVYVNKFLNNPALKWDIDIGEYEIKFVDDTIVVGYTGKGIFEYNKVISNTNGNVNLSQAYNIAEEFLDVDKNLIDLERILKAYNINSQSITLYYNYNQEDFPIIISGELLSSYNMRYPMEITIENGTVKNYKRILIQKEDFMPQKSQLESNYNNVLEKFKEEYNVDILDIKRMYLGYYWGEENYLEMKWVIQCGDTNYIYNVF